MSGNFSDGDDVVRKAAHRLYDIVSLNLASVGVAVLFGGVAMMVAVISYIRVVGSNPAVASRKAQQAKAMRQAYRSMEKQSSLSNTERMKVR
jgi:hypothetical protein